MAEDRGRARRNRPAAALLGLRLGRRPGAGALCARPSGNRARPAACSTSPPAPAWSPSPRPRPAPHRSSPPTSIRSAAAAIAMNAAANGVALDFTAADLIGTDHGWDVVLAGDVFYDRAFAGAADALVRRADRAAARRCWSAIPAAPICRRQRLEPLAVYADGGDARAGGCRGQAHHGLALRLTLSGSRRSIPATRSGRQA